MKKELKFELSGVVKKIYSDYYKIFLLQPSGLKLDLVGRLNEFMVSFGQMKLQINYWTSDKEKTRDEMISNVLNQFYGDLDAEYCSITCQGSSMTGSWNEHYVNLKVGGHDLYEEISSFEDKFILIELNFMP